MPFRRRANWSTFMTQGNALEGPKENRMQPCKQTHGWPTLSLVACVLALGIVACGEKTEPKSPPKTVVPATSPAVPPEARQPSAQTPVAKQPTLPPVNPDAELASRVKAALGGDGSINVHRIDVTAESGVVTLYGTADTADQRAKAGMLAAGVAGVKSVHNKLAIVAGS